MSSDRDIGIGISRVLVDRCGLARERLTQFDPDDFTSALDVLEQVGSGTTGTLLVYWLARPSNEEAARSSLEQVISSSPASAVIILLDRWSWNLPYILDRPSFVVSTTGDDIRLGSALITILDQEGPELTSEDLSGQLGRATRTTHLFSPGGRDLGFAGANNRTEVELTIEAGSPVHSLEAFTSPAGATMIAAGCGDGRILVWEARGGGRVRIVESHSGPVTALCAVDDTHLVSGGQDKRVSIWRTDSGWSSRELTGYRAGINDLTVFGWDSTARIASATEVGELWLSTLKSNQHQAVGGAGKVVAVAGTATDLVAASDRGRVVLSNGTTQRVIGEHGGQVRALAASGRRVVAGGLHHSISLWDLDSGLKVRQWTGHGAGVVALDWIRFPGGAELVVSATSANTIRLWDPETGEQRRMCLLADPPNALTHFTAADGGPRVVSAGMSGVIRIWNPGLTATARTGSVLTRGFGDRTSTVDLLNRGAFIETTAELLRPQSTTDPDVGPNVLTIEGPWGSGKSTMLELVKAELTTGRHSEPGKRLAVWQADRLLRRPPEVVELPPAPPTGSVVASFNPWRHQSSEQVWAGLAKTVTEAVEDAVLPDRDSRERHWFARNATRIDQRHAQRELWKRVRSPFLTVGVLALGVTVVTQLARLPIPIPWLIAVPSSPLVIGLLHTAKRYFWDRASAFLPRELFAGPVLSNAFSSGGNDSVRDPYYNARSGYLYLVQHDVTELLKDLEQHGLQLVVFIDDLDRCTPKTTAEVFEAINVFLSDALPRTRFVLGLDPVVVASHVDHAYRELADAKVVAHPDDPSPGWTFLRKLVQLPIRLPRTTETNIHRVLNSHLGPVHRTDVPTSAPTARPVPGAVVAAPATVAPVPVLGLPQSAVEAVVIAIERHPDVRAHLQRRLNAQPEQSVREEKRLINVWQFYLRVMVNHEDVDRACHLVTIAELVTRWPAYQHALRKGIRRLADAVDDDLAWGATIAELGFKHADATAATNLRALLHDCDAQAVAALAERLL